MPDPSRAIDPYHMWLGIPKNQQPPTHYRLLGIEAFEEDADVIETAASRQVAYLHQLTSGPNRKLTQKLLNEIAKARRTLLDLESREKYNQQLRQRQSAPPPPVDSAPAMSPAPVIDAGFAPPATFDGPVIVVGESAEGGKHKRKAKSNQPKGKSDPVAEPGRKKKPETGNADSKGPSDAPSFDFAVADDKPVAKAKAPAKAKTPPKSKRPDPKQQVPADSTPAPAAKPKDAVPDFGNLNIGVSKPKAEESGGFAGINVAEPTSTTSNPATKASVVTETGKPVAKPKPAKPKTKAVPKAATKPAAATDAPDESAEEQPKKRRKKKGFWQSNDWRIHVGISVVSVIILIIYLANSNTRGGGDGGGGPTISEQEDPSRKFRPPAMQSLDEKFKSP